MHVDGGRKYETLSVLKMRENEIAVIFRRLETVAKDTKDLSHEEWWDGRLTDRGRRTTLESVE